MGDETDTDYPRTSFLYNIDWSIHDNAALRMDEMKLLVGDPGTPDGWIDWETESRKLSTRGANRLTPNNRGDYSGYEIRLYNITANPSKETDLSDNADYADTLATMLTE